MSQRVHGFASALAVGIAAGLVIRIVFALVPTFYLTSDAHSLDFPSMDRCL